MKRVLAALGVLTVAASAAAQQRIGIPITLKCELAKGNVITWQSDGQPKLTTNEGAGSGVTFDQINLATGSARMIGNAGATDVSVTVTGGGLTMMEVTGGGIVVTTLFRRGDVFVGVHSRHIMLSLNNMMILSQYPVTCENLSWR